MSISETSFDGVSVQFAEYADTVRGYVRYEVTQRGLSNITSAKSLRVADIGGGAAIDAVWLAKLGHEVVLVEPSKEQLDEAETKRLSKLPTEVRARISVLEGTAEDLLETGQEKAFDLVLSHGVAMYVSDPQLFISNLAKLTKPKGYLSLLEKGYLGAEARLAQRGQLKELASLRNNNNQANNVGRIRRAFHPEELGVMLTNTGFKVIQWTGVRIESELDYRPISTVPKNELEAIVKKEYEKGKSEQLKAKGQMLHFIAQKK